MDNEYGIKVAMSPVQMAAVFSDRSISEAETLSNHLFGGLGLAGGVVEMFGAGDLCVVPEPTMITKAGCVIVGTQSGRHTSLCPADMDRSPDHNGHLKFCRCTS